MGRHRGTGIGGGHDEREQTLNQILSEMDGFTQTRIGHRRSRHETGPTCWIRPCCDPDASIATLRSIGRPYKGLLAIFQVHTHDIPLADDVDLERVYRRQPSA